MKKKKKIIFDILDFKINKIYLRQLFQRGAVQPSNMILELAGVHQVSILLNLVGHQALCSSYDSKPQQVVAVPIMLKK
jgi:hypothetical protein